MNIVEPIKSRSQIETMKVILRASSKRNELLFVLGINTGLRISDLRQLLVKDVFDGRKVKDRTLIREQKTTKNRMIAMNKQVRNLIHSYLEEERPDCALDEPLFLSQKGGAISRQHAYDILNKAARSIGITQSIGTHTMRKTFGYHAYNKGVSLALIQKILNHSKQADTLRYIGITQEEMDEVMLSLNL